MVENKYALIVVEVITRTNKLPYAFEINASNYSINEPQIVAFIFTSLPLNNCVEEMYAPICTLLFICMSIYVYNSVFLCLYI